MFIDVPIDFDPFLDGIRVKSIKEVEDELLFDDDDDDVWLCLLAICKTTGLVSIKCATSDVLLDPSTTKYLLTSCPLANPV